MAKSMQIRWYGVVCLTLMLAAMVAEANADKLTVYARRDFSLRDLEPALWAVRLGFSHPVFPSNVAEVTEITVAGQKTGFQVRSSKGEAIVSGGMKSLAMTSLVLVPDKPADKSANILVTIKQGLSDATGRRLLDKDFTYTFVSLNEIGVTSHTTFHRSKTEKGVQLQLSSSVPLDDLTKAVTVEPKVAGLRVSRAGGWNYSVTGDFEYNKPYVLSLAPNVVDQGGSILVAKKISFTGPGVRPEISFKSNRSIVELIGRQLLPVKLSNLTKVRCTLTRIPPYMLPELAEAIGAKGLPHEWALYASEFTSLQSKIKVDPTFAGDFSQDSDAFFAPEAQDHVYAYSLPLSFRKNPEKGGAWVATVSDPDTADTPSTRLVQITDLAITYRISEKSLLVWVTSIHTGLPVAGAQVLLYGADRSRYFVGKTDADGVLMVKDGASYPAVEYMKTDAVQDKRPLALANTKWVVAATGSDAGGLRLDSFRLTPKGIRQTARVSDRPDTRTGSVFTERGVYKPGETVHFKYVSRAYKDDQIVSPTGDKVKVEIVGPRDDVVYTKELTLGAFGSCFDSFATKQFFPVGTYTIFVTGPKSAEEGTVQEPSSDRENGEGDEDGEGVSRRKERQAKRPGSFSTTFQVQEFKKIRHYATISLKRAERPATDFVGIKRTEDYLSVEIKGLYYTGGPVKNARARWKASLVPVTNTVKGLSGFFFGNDDDATRFLESGEAVLDKEGKLQFMLPLDPRQLTGICGVEISATVLDVDGEPATEVTTYNPKLTYLVGVSQHPKQVEAGYATELKVVVVDQDGTRVPSGKIQTGVMDGSYFYVRKRDDDGNINWVHEEGWRRKFASTQDIKSGEAIVPLEFHESGKYMVELTYEDAGGRYTTQTLFAVGWRPSFDWDEVREEKERATGQSMLLSMSKKEYRVGESVEVEFFTPKPCKKFLASVERGDIIEYRVIDGKDRAGKFAFPLTEPCMPNVYVSVIGSSGRAGFPVYSSQADLDVPMVFYGAADIAVRSEVRQLKLDIAADVEDLKGRPAEEKSLTFKVTDNKGNGVVAEMAVCVVDEAILALTRYVTPQLGLLAKFDLPLSVFFGDMRLDLISQDLQRLFPTRPLTGGGMGLSDVNPSLRKDFRPVAYFNPAVVTDQSGQATVHFKLPDSTTAYRVYAVVCDKGAGFVSGQRRMVVTKEFFMEPSLPRFLIPGDKATFPIIVQNKTLDKGKALLAARVTQGLTVKLLQPEVTLDPWSSTVAKSYTEVTGGIDSATFTFDGKFAGEKARFDDAVELTIPIHSRYIPVDMAVVGDFVQKVEIPVKLPAILKTLNPDDISPNDFKAVLSLSTTPWAKIAPGLRYLLHYPYGCVEQTSSGVIPLAGLRGLVKQGLLPGIGGEQVDKFLGGGVNRLLSMQTASGGFAYWPGSNEACWWGTMYATFALSMAKEGGYEVPVDRMNKALDFLRSGLDGKEKDRYHGDSWANELALFNLALWKQLTPQELDGYFARYDAMSDEHKALLLLAAKHIGYSSDDKLKGRLKKLDPRFDPARTDFRNSSYREIAVCMLAAVRIGGDSKKLDTWAGYLLRNLKPQGCWVSTADTGWCLMALAEYFKGKDTGKKQEIPVTIEHGAEKPTQAKVSDTTSMIELDPRKLLEKGTIEVKSPAKGLITYTLALTYPDMSTDPARLSHGFSLQKKIENLSGKEEIYLGDVVRVTLEIDLQDPSLRYSGRVFDYLALVDPVPAGMVPINSELKTEGVSDSEKEQGDRQTRFDYNAFRPNYQEFRDDGVRVFKDRAWSGRFTYTYLARAVAEGEFWMRGSRISLMYDPDYFGRTLGKKVKILPIAK